MGLDKIGKVWYNGDTMNLEITLNEALVLHRQLHVEDVGQDLFLELGTIILSGQPCMVDFTEDNLWYALDHVDDTIRVGGETTGLNLMRKFYSTLHAIEVEKLGVSMGIVEEPEPPKLLLVEMARWNGHHGGEDASQNRTESTTESSASPATET